MPNTYYWQGSTGSDISKYDWNYGPNWKVANYGKPTSQWATSATAPGANDTVYVGDTFVAKSPILYGGYSGSVAGSTGTTLWLNAQQTTGTTFNSSLNSLFVKMVSPNSATGTNYYPFPYFGGGITGDIYFWAANVDGWDTSTLTGITGARANLGLTVKVAYNTYVYTTGQINRNFSIGGLDGNGYPNYSVVNLNFVTSKNYNNGGTAACYSTLFIGGGGGNVYNPYATKSAAAVGHGNVTINGGSFQNAAFDNSLSAAPGGYSGSVIRPYVISVANMVVGNIAVHNGDIFVDKSCTFGTFTIKGGSTPYYPPLDMGKYSTGYDGRNINLAGTFNTQSANTLLGWATSVTASPFVSGVYLYDQYTTLPGVDGYDYTPTILLGNPADGATFTAQTVAVFNEVAPYSITTNGNSQRPWRIEFFGDSNITSMSTEGTTIAAWKNLDPSKQLNITKLTMAEQSVLDLNYASQFDNWFFGTLTGGSVAGGINFNDGTCAVIGSAGVRLYNTKVVNSFDFRSGASVPVAYAQFDVSPADGNLPSVPG